MGIVLTYNKNQAENDSNAICNDILKRLYDYGSLRSTDIRLDNAVFLKHIFRKNEYSGSFETSEGSIVWWGRPLYKGNLLKEDMFPKIQETIKISSINSLMNDISGHFQIVLYLKKSKECFVICDRVSSYPAYYIDTEGFVAVTPEPLTFKALRKYGCALSIRQGSVFEYMSSGYLWGDSCFFNEVKRLGPGQILCLGQRGIQIQTYWRMTFEKTRVSQKDLIVDLFEAIQKDIDDLPNGKKILTLSGGYDSRALLGFLKDDRDLDTVSYSYGLKNTQGTDIDIGEYYAGKVGVSHSYYQTSVDDTSRLIEDIQDTITATSGENYLSAFQDAFLGKDFYRKLAADYDYMIRGDEVWGWADLAVTKNMSFWETRLFNLNEIAHTKKIMTLDSFNTGIRYINDRRQELIKDCGDPNISANDFKDYLYWRHREARLLQSMAYFRRCYIPHFAPFLFDRTLAVIRRTPSKFRIQKNLFIKMGKKIFPELFLNNKAISPHMADINNFDFLYTDKKFLSFVKVALLESSSDMFTNLFDRKMFESWINNILEKSQTDVGILRKKHDLKRMTVGLIEKSAYLKGYMKAFMVKNGMNTFPVLGVNYLFRLVVLSLSLQEYEKK